MEYIGKERVIMDNYLEFIFCVEVRNVNTSVISIYFEWIVSIDVQRKYSANEYIRVNGRFYY